jgi:hypothetical protein
MLGEQVAEETGKVTTQRVLPTGAHGPEIEVSFEGRGTLLGIGATDLGTYTAVLRSDGTFYGQGQGIVMTEDGEAATWIGNGVGRFTGEGGAVSWRGAIYYYTASQKLARLNSVAAIYEFEVDEDGGVQNKVWEWK